MYYCVLCTHHVSPESGLHSYLLEVIYLIAPESIFIKPSEAVDNNRDWQGKSEDTENRTQSSKNLAHKCLKITYSLRIFLIRFPVLHQDLRHSPL